MATFCAYFNTTQGAGIGHMITKPAHSSWTAPYASFSLSNYNWNDMNLQATISGTERNLVFDTGWASNTYNLLCGVYDGVTLRNSLNGVLNETGIYASALSGTDPAMPLLFGQRLAAVTTEQFIGLIDEFFYFPFNVSSVVITDLYNTLRKNAGYGNLGAIELNVNHLVEFTNQPPNITLVSGNSIYLRENASCTQADTLNFTINDTSKFEISQAGILVNKSLGVTRGLFNLWVNASDQNNASVKADFWVNLTCTAAYTCISYGTCNGSNITPCLGVMDFTCGDPPIGNLSAYDGACACNSTYTCTNYQPCSFFNVSSCDNVTDPVCDRPYLGNATDFNLACVYTPAAPFNSSTNLILLAIGVFFWVAMVTLTFTFRSFALASMMWISGIVLGFFFAQVFYIGVGFGFILLCTFIFLWVGSNHR